MKAAVALLLSLYAFLALSASTRKGASYDEGEEVAVGYDIWLHHDFRMEAANGDLIKRWATLPYLLSRPRFPRTDDADWRGGMPYRLGFKLLFTNGNRPESLLLQARFMVTLIGVAAGILVFFCAREIFGDAGGLISLCIFAFSPQMLSFGAIVSTDMSISMTLLGATWCVWLLLHRVTWKRLSFSLTFVGLLVLSKMTALLIVPITVTLLAVRFIRGAPLEWSLGQKRLIRSGLAQARIFFVLFLLHAFVAWGTIWAAYGFRYAASPDPSDPGVVFKTRVESDPINPTVLSFIHECRSKHFLPEGFLHGVEWLLGENDERQAFMDGRWSIDGWKSFFPYAIWAKTPPSLFLLLILGLVAWRASRHRPAGPESSEAAAAPSIYAAAPFIVLIIVYLPVAMIQRIDIGVRHVLPIYPPLYILAGSTALLWSSKNTVARVVVAGLLAALAINSSAVYPDYLAYFSPMVGGPAQGYRHLVDSSLDWGMNLPGLRRWLDKNNPGDRDPLYLAYFGTGSPDYYHLKYHWLYSGRDWQAHPLSFMGPGIYAISATTLQQVGTLTSGPWTLKYEKNYQAYLSYMQRLSQILRDPALREKFKSELSPALLASRARIFDALSLGRLCAWLRHNRPPDAEVDYSILIWQLSADDLRSALLGPPAELTDNLYVRNWHR